MKRLLTNKNNSEKALQSPNMILVGQVSVIHVQDAHLTKSPSPEDNSSPAE